MRSWRRIVYFLLLNVLVSAVTTWAVVTIFLRDGSPLAEQSAPTLVRQTASPDGQLVVTLPADSGSEPLDEDIEVVPEVLEIERVIGIGELDTERVIIQHIGEKEISLLNWQIQDQNGHIFTFPALTIFKGGNVNIFTRKGTSTVVDLYWGLDEAIWQAGEKAFLLDPQGEVKAVYTIP
ncbi:MAG TPA: lamin tail domain-containing protein [Anaerolineales bacterium]|jgi:hypothetical protein|nr:lamin tail domain-containing protein [Anaerolineales bacterium]